MNYVEGEQTPYAEPSRESPPAATRRTTPAFATLTRLPEAEFRVGLYEAHIKLLRAANEKLQRDIERLEAGIRQPPPQTPSEPARSDVLARCMRSDRPLDAYGR